MRKKYNRLLLLISLFLLNNTEKISTIYKTVVLIDDLVKKISPDYISHDIDLWVNKIENSCKRCLIKFAPEILNQNANFNFQDIIDTCTNPNKKQCDIDLINRLKNENKLHGFKNTHEKLKKLIEILNKKSVITRQVYFNNKIFNQDGYFANSESVAKFLQQAYSKGKLSDQSFRSLDCINVKYSIRQNLFKINSRCNLIPRKYILKEFNPKVREKIARNIFPVAYISYSYNNQEHYLILFYLE